MSDDFMTLEDLCRQDAVREVSVPTGKAGEKKTIRYRLTVPLKMLLKWQAQCKMGTREPDQEGYYARLLQYCLLNPRVPDLRSARILLEGDGGLMMQIIGDVMKSNMNIGEDKVSDEELGELGESSGSAPRAAEPAA